MKKRSVLAFGLLTACGGILVAACGSEDGTPHTPQTSAGASGAPPTTSGGGGSATVTAGATSAGATTVAGAESAGTGGTGPTCDVPLVTVFSQAATDQSWDDNNFYDAAISGTCPLLVDITWPHDPEWPLPDKVDANHEFARLTLDYNVSGDLTGKVIHVDLELTQDMRGPKATSGGYKAYLLSVSTFDILVEADPPPPAGGSGGSSGSGGDGGTAGTPVAGLGGLPDGAGTGGASGGTGGESGGAATSGSAGDSSGSGGTAPTATPETGYTEAISEGSFTFTRVGEKARLSFALPNKTDAIGSYDPARAIKINLRIDSVFPEPEPLEEGTAGGGGASASGGSGGAAGLSGSGGVAGLGGGGIPADSGGLGGDSSGGVAGAVGGASGSAGGPSPAPGGPVYDYLTTQFAITNFTISDM